MANGRISIDRILSRLDEFLHKNDYASAERHLLYWLSEAKSGGDVHTELFVRNELMGLYRKLSRENEALLCVSEALEKIEKENISHQVGAATTFLNAATVYKAFGRAEESLPLFLRAREVYERELAPDDGRLGGLYNNMALTLVDIGRFCEANELYAACVPFNGFASFCAHFSCNGRYLHRQKAAIIRRSRLLRGAVGVAERGTQCHKATASPRRSITPVQSLATYSN